MLEFYRSQTKNRRIISLVGGFIIHIVIGTVYITGNISIYMASYLQHEGYDVNLNQLSIILPLQIVGTSMSLLIGSYITTKIGPWLTAAIGNSIVIFAVFITSFLKSYPLIIIIYGLLYGFGVGITYTTPLILSWGHFPNYKGRISGIVISGFGFGSSIFNLVTTHMINPNNETPDHKIHGEKYFKSSIANKYPETLRWLALIYLLLSIIGIALLGSPEKKDELSTLVEKNKDNECPSLKEGIKTKRFWHLFIMALMSITPGLYIVNVYKTFGKSRISNDEFLTIVGSVSSVFNGSFRYIWGWFMDKYTFKKSYAILIIIQTVFIMTLYYIASVEALYLIWVCVIVCCEGGHFSLYPTVIARMYGKQMGGKIYGAMFFCFAIGAILGFLLQNFLTGVVGYQILFWVLGVISLLSLVVLYFFTEVNLWEDSKQSTEIKSINSNPA